MSFVKENRGELTRLTAMSLALVFSWLGVWKRVFPIDIIALGTTIIGGYPMFREAYESVRERRMTMELSMFIAVTATLAIGQFSTGLVITIFVLFAELLEHQTVTRGRSVIRKLLDYLPHSTIVRRGGTESEIDIAALTPDDVVVIRPGAKIPVDGTVTKGASMVDQSSITGESLPVEKGEGNDVYAGTFNHSGVLEVRARRIGKDTTFGRIIDIIEKAEQSRAPIEKIADRLSAWLVYFALTGSVLTFVFTHSIVSAISALIVAGACGVAAGTPLAILAGIGRTAKEGIIVKGGVYLQQLAKVDTVVLDKTGTLTLGVPQVVRIRSYNGVSRKEVLELATIAEQHSEHPLAAAVVKKAKENNIRIAPYLDVKYLPGQGIVCHVNGDEILVGNRSLMLKESVRMSQPGINVDSHPGHSGESTVYVAKNGRLAGLIGIGDVLRRDAVETVEDLKHDGHRVILLTGDSHENAHSIGAALGVDEVYAEVLPEKKVEKIRELKAQGHTVAMVGDGINDAPALYEADVGIAMGAGTEIALESAHTALTTNDLTKIVEALRIARQCLRVIFFNFWGTIAVDAAGVALAFLGLLSPLVAALIHVTSELAFILNSARLFRS